LKGHKENLVSWKGYPSLQKYYLKGLKGGFLTWYPFLSRRDRLENLPGIPSTTQGRGIPSTTKAFHSFIPFHNLKKKGQKRRVFFCFTAFVLLRKTTKQQPKYYFLKDTSEKGQFSCVPSWQPFPVPFFFLKKGNIREG